MRSGVLTRRVVVAAFSSVSIALSRAMSVSTNAGRVIDSHLHVWANSDEASRFPYIQDPPENLANRASTAALLEQMEQNGVDGALIVQPINHKYDHSYVIQAIKAHPDRFKGMLLHDPTLSEEDAIAHLEELAAQGFVGVRFNPYLWPKLGEKRWAPMSQGAGLAVYKRCAELKMPVGVMCFQGLPLHFEDILELLKASPDTTLIFDHFGFTSVDDTAAFDQLLQLANYKNVYVKISALFRLNDPFPYERVQKERFQPLVEAFGADRLMYGSDFPYVLEQPQGYAMVDLVSSWVSDEKDRIAIMGGTAERVFGLWGSAASHVEL
jgi:predicted TIM-barrel fold metal-dependent hydrolase